MWYRCHAKVALYSEKKKKERKKKKGEQMDGRTGSARKKNAK
jgi:hypothetical protein